MTDRIRVGLIGVGGIVTRPEGHLDRLLRLPEVEIVALADASEQSIAKALELHGERLPGVPTMADYCELLEKTRPDAVVIATPHTQHFGQAMDALDAGAHVLLEKPMVNRVVDAHALLKKIDETGKVVGLSYQRHTQPRFRYIKNKIASGELGAVQFVSALQQQGWKESQAGTWRQEPALSGGGQINDSGSHLLDIMLWSAGLAPDEVSAFMDYRGTRVDINSAVTVRFTNGAQGTISVIGDAPGRQYPWWEQITIWCDKGAFFVRDGDGVNFQVQGTDGNLFAPAASDMPAATEIQTNFIRAIQGAEEIAATPADGLRTIQLTEAAWESAAAGGRVTNVRRD